MNYINVSVIVERKYGSSYEQSMIPINSISRIAKGTHVSERNGWPRETNVHLGCGKYGLVPIYGAVIYTKSGESFKVNESFDELSVILNKTEHDIEREKKSERDHNIRNSQKLFNWVYDEKRHIGIGV